VCKQEIGVSTQAVHSVRFAHGVTNIFGAACYDKRIHVYDTRLNGSGGNAGSSNSSSRNDTSAALNNIQNNNLMGGISTRTSPFQRSLNMGSSSTNLNTGTSSSSSNSKYFRAALTILGTSPVGCIRWQPIGNFPSLLASSSSVMDHQIMVWDLRQTSLPVFVFNSHRKGDNAMDFLWASRSHIVRTTVIFTFCSIREMRQHDNGSIWAWSH
jgi:hypothetical protein